ncbi:MAG: hypothetical protein WCN98_13250 [Verrucomicrobiaceae bacterium]
MKYLLLPAVLLLAACTTVPTPPVEKPGYLRVLEQKQVAPSTVALIAGGRVLGYADLKNLVAKGIPGSMIVPYLKATRTPYDYSTKDINGLINAGADDVLVNYLGKAKGIYLEDENDAPTSADGNDGGSSHPYFSDPGYVGAAPFAFGYPDAWYGDYGYYNNHNRGGEGGSGHGGR